MEKLLYATESNNIPLFVIELNKRDGGYYNDIPCLKKILKIWCDINNIMCVTLILENSIYTDDYFSEIISIYYKNLHNKKWSRRLQQFVHLMINDMSKVALHFYWYKFLETCAYAPYQRRKGMPINPELLDINMINKNVKTMLMHFRTGYRIDYAIYFVCDLFEKEVKKDKTFVHTYAEFIINYKSVIKDERCIKANEFINSIL